MSEGWEAYLTNTMTGVLGPKLSLKKAGTWEEKVNAAGGCTPTVNLDDLWDLDQRTWEPWTGSIALLHDGVPVSLGPILDDPSVNFKERHAVWPMGSFWDLLDHRVVTDQDYGPGAHVSLSKSNLTLSGQSLGNFAWRVVQAVQRRPNGSLPVVCRMPLELTSRTRTYEGFNLSNNTASKRLKEITEVIGGPDILFYPEWVDDRHDRLQWVMAHGTEGQPTIPQEQMHTFDMTAPGTDVVTTDIQTSYSPLRRVYGTGAGEGSGILIRVAQENPWRGPMLEGVFSDTQIDNDLLLESKIQALLNPRRIVQISMKVNQEWPGPGSWRAGEWHQLVLPEGLHPLVKGGLYMGVALRRSGSLTDAVVESEFQAIEVAA